jgi:hypothetical protein
MVTRLCVTMFVSFGESMATQRRVAMPPGHTAPLDNIRSPARSAPIFSGVAAAPAAFRNARRLSRVAFLVGSPFKRAPSKLGG